MPFDLKEAVGDFGPPLRTLLEEAYGSARVEAYVKRVSDSASTPSAALLGGVCQSPSYRARWEYRVDSWAMRQTSEFSGTDYTPEIVVGAGLHGTVYAANRVKLPLVVEQSKRIGGIFAMSKVPAFFLNSRNRPENGGPRLPGTKGPLNTIYGARVQPSDLGGEEYQDNTQMAFAIRASLVVKANVLMGRSILSVTDAQYGDSRGRYLLRLVTPGGGRSSIATDRIIFATGLGNPSKVIESSRTVSFIDWLSMVDRESLPKDKRVAVVGAGDSGSVLVEYWLGQGPTSPLQSELPERIEWFGQEYRVKEDYERAVRSRYAGIGRYMPRVSDPEYYYRVRPRPGKVVGVEEYPGGVRLKYRTVDGRIKTSDKFDRVYFAVGFDDKIDRLVKPLVPLARPLMGDVEIDGKVVAKKYTDHEIYKVGPCANIGVTREEIEASPVLRSIPANSVALFRYTERTAALARSFD